VTEVTIEDYLSLYDQNLRTKTKQLYQGKCIRSVRYYQEGERIFIASRVSAEMIKNCVYNVDICLDLLGVVQEAQCECSAGTGPQAHCKHVAVTLFALIHTKDGILTKDTCTQELQTFHQSKSYGGSPVKMQDLKLRSDGSLFDLRDFDPRPVHFRATPQYNGYFRNVCLNSQVEELPIRQLYQPANLHGVNNDHDYLKLCPADLYLHHNHITVIDEAERERVEKETRGQAKSKLWKAERTKRLHASNFGKICTATEKTNFVALAKSFTSTTEFSSAPTNHGKKYESHAITNYSLVTGNKVDQSGILVCRDMPYLAASPDGLVGQDGMVEVKCPFSAKDDMITTTSVLYLSEDDNANLLLKKSHFYFYQVQGLMLCSDRSWCDFVIWTLKDIKIIRIVRDNDFICEMQNRLTSFFQQHFKDAVLKKYFYRM
jgi:hypothetical protein